MHACMSGWDLTCDEANYDEILNLGVATKYILGGTFLGRIFFRVCQKNS